MVNDVADLDDNIWEEVDSNGLPTKISARTAYIDPPFYRLKPQYQNWKFAIPILKESHLWILFATAWETKSPETVSRIRGLINNEDLPLVNEAENENCLYREKCTPKMTELLEKFYFLSEATIKLSGENNTPVIVSILPANPQVKERAEFVDRYNEFSRPTLDQIPRIIADSQPQNTWKEFFNNQNVPVIDPLPYMVDKGWQTFYFSQDGHPTVDGNKALSEAFFDFFINDYLILSKINN